MEKKLEVKNLKISFRTQAGKVQAVRGINFDLYKGETLAIVGESGSGKSVTNRAVMGILAANGIIESGKILYDGQDLVQISEEDFHKIRGDKIAMIFQDPLSSLNPIMRIGRQLTEAMILKNKTSKSNAKSLFNNHLNLLLENMNLACGNDSKIVDSNKEKCRIFDKFCVESINMESVYNEAFRQIEELKSDLDDFLFLVEKKQKVDGKKSVKDFLKRINKCVHPRLLVIEDLSSIIESINSRISSVNKSVIPEELVAELKKLSVALEEASKKEKPNFFCLGYYKLRNPQADIDSMPVKEINETARCFIDDEFMREFIKDGEKALEFSHKASIENKKALLNDLEKALEYFKSGSIEKGKSEELLNVLCKKVDAAIDRMEIIKNSTDYTFKSSLSSSISKYFAGIKKNVSENKRYERQYAKWKKLADKGKTPDWKVVPAALFDAEIGINNICDVISGLIENIKFCVSEDSNFNAFEKMNSYIDYLKEQASNAVFTLTKKMAKSRALKIMEEVGIPEPNIRYNQFPFEFSGGMRQRIVIAIALSANPDILICDEPTTALDVTIQAQILELINKLKEQRNLSVIFITHNLGVVANMADRIAVMYAGKIVEYGTADEVFYDPKHPYTWALLSSMPDLETKEKLESIPGTPPNMIFPPEGDAFAVRNKYAMQIDFEEEPPMFRVSDTHYAATWLLHPNAPKVEMPNIIKDRIARMKKLEKNND